MNKDKIIKDLKKRNDSLKMQYEYRNIRCIHLEKENEILRENAENNDKVVDKVNWENNLLKKENQQLKKQKDDVVEYIKNYIKFRKEFDLDKLLRMLGEIE